MPKFFIILKSIVSFTDEDALTSHLFTSGKLPDDKMIVKGEIVEFVPQGKFKIAGEANGTPAPKRDRKSKAPDEPTPDVRAQVMAVFATGAKCTKATVRAHLTGYGTDTVDNAIDWLTHAGKLTRDKKTYRAATPTVTEGVQS